MSPQLYLLQFMVGPSPSVGIRGVFVVLKAWGQIVYQCIVILHLGSIFGFITIHNKLAYQACSIFGFITIHNKFVYQALLINLLFSFHTRVVIPKM